MPYWAAARLQPQRERLALHCLGLAGFATYLPRVRERRVLRGQRIKLQLPLFPGYCFVAIELQWHAARWAPGTLGLVLNGLEPARIPDAVIAEIRSRERDGMIELPSKLCRGSRVRILRGPFTGHLAIYAGMSGRDRVAVLLEILGGQQRVTLVQQDIEVITS
jgi:transcriptional antiterminator RfaH